MRIIDLHCYPGTQTWIDAQGPYPAELARYWKREWVAKPEDEVVKEFETAGVEACLVALDLETTVATPPCTNEYVHGMWKRHPKRIIQCWGAVECDEHVAKFIRTYVSNRLIFSCILQRNSSFVHFKFKIYRFVHSNRIHLSEFCSLVKFINLI